MPATPYRGIQPFRYVDHPIFFAREHEARYLARLVAMYRGVLLYGDSGNGKSSLINAALLPEVIGLGFHPERVRVQPRDGEELVIERIASADDESEYVPSLLAPPDDDSSRVVLSTEAFETRIRAAHAGDDRPLLIFDQFEEILTLFEEARADELRRRIVALLIRLLREPLAVKLLFAFREDYLGKVTQLFATAPELVDQALRLTPPAPDALPTIIRGPFERYPDRFARAISPELAERLRAALAQRFGTGDLSLSEVQTVCLRLWQASDPEALLATRGVQGLLEDYLGEALDAFPPDVRGAAITLLGQMVTSAGTRNVMSAEDLIQRAREDEDLSPALLQDALERLESESRLIRRERRRDLYLYEVTSEFLLPWISRHREEFRRTQERRRYRRRLRFLGSLVGALLIVAAAVTLLALYAVQQQRDAQDQRGDAQRQRNEAQRQSAKAAALGLTVLAARQLKSRPDVSMLLALAALRARPELVEARTSLLAALPATRGSLGIFHGHTGPVAAIALSPDGNMLASASEDNTVRLWDVRTHEQLGPPITGRDRVRGIEFSPDGKTLAYASGDGTVRLLNVRTREEAKALSGSPGGVNDVAFSPDGKLLASVGFSGVQLWDASTHARHGRALRSPGFEVAFSPDGRTLAIAGLRTQLWNFRTGELRSTKGRFGVSVAFSSDGTMLAHAGFDSTVLRDVRTLEPIGGPIGGRGDQVSGVAFSPDDSIVASAHGDGSVRLWSVRDASQLGEPLTGHTDSVSSVAFSRDGRTLASGSSDNTIRLWDTRAGTPPDVPHVLDAGARGVAFSPDGEILASAGRDRTVRLWNARSRKPIGEPLTGHTGPILSVAFSPDGEVLASGGTDRTIRLWDVRIHRQIGAPLTGHRDWVKSVAFSHDGKIVASGGDDSTVRLWDAGTHEQLGRRLTGHDDWVNSVAFSPRRQDRGLRQRRPQRPALGRRDPRAARPASHRPQRLRQQRRLQPRRRHPGLGQRRRHGPAMGRPDPRATRCAADRPQ